MTALMYREKGINGRKQCQHCPVVHLIKLLFRSSADALLIVTSFPAAFLSVEARSSSSTVRCAEIAVKTFVVLLAGYLRGSALAKL